MTKLDFAALPYLLTLGQVEQCGYTQATLDKYAACGILEVIVPPGCIQRRFQKRQVAQILGWEDTLDVIGWRREKPLLSVGMVHQWTGYNAQTIAAIAAAGGLDRVQPGGVGNSKYRKEAVGAWLGLENLRCQRVNSNAKPAPALVPC